MKITAAFAVIVLSLAAACADEQVSSETHMEQGMATISGTVFYRERIALPPGAEVSVELQDVSRADAPAEVLASTRFRAEGGPPYGFELSYDPADIDQRMSYALRAAIRADGELLFTTDTHHPAFDTDEHELLVVGVARSTPAGGPRPAGGLTGRDWVLTELGGEAVGPAAGGQRPSIHFEAGVRVYGFAGCNRFHGSYETRGAVLEFSPLAMTRRACAEGMETEQRFADALSRVAGYEIDEDTLALLDAGGERLAVLRAGEVPESRE